MRESAEFPLHESGGTRYVTSALLDGEAGLLCRFFGRAAEAIEADTGFPSPPLAVRQVHGDTIVVVEEGAMERLRNEPVEGDAVITRVRGVPVTVRTADCASIVVYDRRTPALGVVHAGWRGTVRSVLWKTVLMMVESFGTDPNDCMAATGPAIAGTCYEVGDDVWEAYGKMLPYGHDLLRRAGEGRWMLDLVEGNRRQLLDARIPAGQTATCPYCTHCAPEWFHSARRDGAAAGRQATVAMLR